MGYIYYCKNLINGKGYIGQTSINLETRMKEHLRHVGKKGYENIVFYKALEKYGKDNFSWTILEECDNSLLDEKEIYWIKEKNTFYLDNGWGYNMTYGGKDASTVFGKRLRAYKIVNGKLTEPRIFESTKAAARVLSEELDCIFEGSKIAYICNGKGYSHHGYTFCYIDENNNDIQTGYHHTRKRIPVQVFFNNDFMSEYPSIRQASLALNIHEETIKRKLQNGTNYGSYTFKSIS